MGIIVNRNIAFLDSLQLCNNARDTVTSSLKHEDFRHLISEFGVDKTENQKEKMHILTNR